MILAGIGFEEEIQNIRLSRKYEETPISNKSVAFNVSLGQQETDLTLTKQGNHYGVLNEDLFGPLTNGSVIVIVQVSQNLEPNYIQ